MPRGFLLKMRARMASARQRKSAVKGKLKRLERLEERLEGDIEELREETERLENLGQAEAKHMREFGWITGRMTTLVLQDFVGAAIGAVFFVVTQEVWELSLRLTAPNLAGVFALSFILTFLLIYLSRRRKFLSAKLYHTSFLRSLEIYIVSLVTAAAFVLIFGTAYGIEPVLKQSVVVALPAALSAATADLLFY